MIRAPSARVAPNNKVDQLVVMNANHSVQGPLLLLSRFTKNLESCLKLGNQGREDGAFIVKEEWVVTKDEVITSLSGRCCAQTSLYTTTYDALLQNASKSYFWEVLRSVHILCLAIMIYVKTIAITFSAKNRLKKLLWQRSYDRLSTRIKVLQNRRRPSKGLKLNFKTTWSLPKLFLTEQVFIIQWSRYLEKSFKSIFAYYAKIILFSKLRLLKY